MDIEGGRNGYGGSRLRKTVGFYALAGVIMWRSDQLFRRPTQVPYDDSTKELLNTFVQPCRSHNAVLPSHHAEPLDCWVWFSLITREDPTC